MINIIIAEPSNDAEAETVVIITPVQLVLTVSIAARGSFMAAMYASRSNVVLLSEVIFVCVVVVVCVLCCVRCV